ncbi:hypothetical protein ABIE65_002649 [Constrictibacter sp. MBR-5]|jgi:hypothetical protein|uniref:hypothetical protein n=1 Tax=Constrictibacter sp. MBR-5 TaxID=3156467 RepID=UPI003397F1FD
MVCDVFLAITAHGYGHATQAGAVVRALRERRPNLGLTVQTTLPREFLDDVIRGPFDLVPAASDIGLVNRSAFEVDVEASAAAYRAFHADWDERVAAAADSLRAISPRLVLSDVPYLPLAAAARHGIPAVGFCSLNWADIYAHYLGGRPEAGSVIAQIREAYASASIFIVPAPGMPMPWLETVRPVGPCAARGVDRRAELASRCGAAPGDRLVMVAVGGLPWQAGYGDWPVTPGFRWVVQGGDAPGRRDMMRLADAGMPAIDVMASVDAVVGKLGYSLPVEAACHGKPMLYVPRPDWPETPYVSAWMERHAASAGIDLESLRDGRFVGALQGLLAVPSPTPVDATGAGEAADMILDLLR